MLLSLHTDFQTCRNLTQQLCVLVQETSVDGCNVEGEYCNKVIGVLQQFMRTTIGGLPHKGKSLHPRSEFVMFLPPCKLPPQSIFVLDLRCILVAMQRSHAPLHELATMICALMALCVFSPLPHLACSLLFQEACIVAMSTNSLVDLCGRGHLNAPKFITPLLTQSWDQALANQWLRNQG